MKALLLSLIASSAIADQLTLEVPYAPYAIRLDPAVSVTGCYAGTATASKYKSVVTGFSADGNYVLGQVLSRWVCGNGRGSAIRYGTACTYLQWDLSGALTSVMTPTVGLTNLTCPPADPTATYTNSGGYLAETIIAQACGAIACYATYYYPTLVTP
jgi:hypothetical protein